MQQDRRALLRRFAAASFMVIGGSLLAPCNQPAAAADGELSFYSGLQRQITDALVADFQSKNPGIKVRVFQATIESLLQKIELEVLSTKRIQADVIWTGDFSILKNFKKRGLLEKYLPKDIDKIPAALKDSDGYWEVTVPLTMNIMYNRDRVKGAEIPKTWKELADPRWNGRLALSNPATSGTAAILAAALADKYGWQFWQAIGKGKPFVSPSTVSLLNTVVSGERDIVPMVDFLVSEAIRQKKPVGVVAPSDGLVATHIIAALVKGSPNEMAGKRLIDYLVSTDAAKLLADKGFYHARIDAPAPEGLTPLNKLKLIEFDWDKYDREKDQVKDRFRDATQQ